MALTFRKSRKKFFTVAEAEARLPLLRSVLRDVVELAAEMKSLHGRLIVAQSNGDADASANDQVAILGRELDARQNAMQALVKELRELGADLKDPIVGLIDFPGLHEDREICLCWKLGEPHVAHWHETDAGFAGRRPIETLTEPERS